MTARHDADRVITLWLTETSPEGRVDYLDETLRALESVRQRPAWASPWRWLPMQTTLSRVPVPRVAPLILISLLLLVLAIVAVGIVGSRPQLPAPFGLAATGLIAFESDGDILATDVDGTARRTVVAEDGAQWSPVFSRQGDRMAYWSGATVSAPASLWVANADGSTRQPVTGEQRFVVGADLPAMSFSPDGRRLAFATDDGVLYVVNADGTGLRQIGDDSQERRTPSWSPDGTLIAYGAHLVSQPYRWSTWVIAPDGAGDTQVIPPKTSDEITNVNPSWSPDGRSILVHTGPTTDTDITIATRDAEGAWTERPVVAGTTSEFLPAWSSSGTRFSFLRLVPDSYPEAVELMVADADGSGIRRVSAGPVRFAANCWSPDDRFIRAASAGEDGPDRTFELIPLDGSAAVQVAAPGMASTGVCEMQRVSP